jgi:hypothetical protein
MKTKMLLKNIVMVCMFLLLAVGTAQPVHAEEPANQPAHVYGNSSQQIKVGDYIYVHKDSLYYLTGERISKWVYQVNRPVIQVGGKRFPNGILIGGIYSWISANSILPVNPEEPEPVVKEEPIVEEQPIVEETTPVVEETEPVVDTVSVVEQPVKDTASVTNVKVSSLDKGSYEIPVSYDKDRLSIGVRGGFASTMTNVNGLPVGYDALFDLRYAHYWAGDKNQCLLGIMTGLGAGYVACKQSTEILEDLVLATDEGDVNYTISAENVAETTSQIQLEVPIMFTMLTPGGFFMNVGPKLIVPVHSTFKQTITNPVISAYLPELNGKPITNNIVMGKLTEEQCNLNGSLGNEFNLSIALGLELGYEFKLKNGHSIDLGVYADYTVFSAYQNQAKGASVISIVPPSANSSAVVDVLPLTNAYANQFGFLDAGLKLTYNFDFLK